MRGIWASGALPAEFEDFALMDGMGWSWEELQATPLYVRRFCMHFLEVRADIQAEQQAESDRQRRDAGG